MRARALWPVRDSGRRGEGRPGGRRRRDSLPFCRLTLRVPFPCPGYPKEPRSVGEHLLKRRRDLGLTQGQVAQALGVNAGTVITSEKNRQAPSGRRLLAIIRFLGYDPRAG
jgi:DNA-binding XRE family transcriptional regulator